MMTDRQIREAYERFKRGERIKDLAAELGVSYGALRKRFAETYGYNYAEASMIDKFSRRRAMSREQAERAWQAYKADSELTLDKIAEQHYVSNVTVRNTFMQLHPDEYKAVVATKPRGRCSLDREQAKELFEMFSGPKAATISELVIKSNRSWSVIKHAFYHYELAAPEELDSLIRRAVRQSMATSHSALTDKQLDHILWQYGHTSATMEDIARQYRVSRNCLQRSLAKRRPEEYLRAKAIKPARGRAANGTQSKTDKR